MSRQRIYVDGKPDWTDEGPAYARRPGFGGALVVAIHPKPKYHGHPGRDAARLAARTTIKEERR